MFPRTCIFINCRFRLRMRTSSWSSKGTNVSIKQHMDTTDASTFYIFYVRYKSQFLKRRNTVSNLTPKAKKANHVVNMTGFTDLRNQYSYITGKEKIVHIFRNTKSNFIR